MPSWVLLREAAVVLRLLRLQYTNRDDAKHAIATTLSAQRSIASGKETDACIAVELLKRDSYLFYL